MYICFLKKVLIAFYSTKFPTEKALSYIQLRNPYLLNDLEMDSVLKDRRKGTIYIYKYIMYHIIYIMYIVYYI